MACCSKEASRNCNIKCFCFSWFYSSVSVAESAKCGDSLELSDGGSDAWFTLSFVLLLAYFRPFDSFWEDKGQIELLHKEEAWFLIAVSP